MPLLAADPVVPVAPEAVVVPDEVFTPEYEPTVPVPPCTCPYPVLAQTPQLLDIIVITSSSVSIGLDSTSATPNWSTGYPGGEKGSLS